MRPSHSTKTSFVQAPVPEGLFECFFTQPSLLAAPVDLARSEPFSNSAPPASWSLGLEPALLREARAGQSWEVLGSPDNGGFALIGQAGVVDAAWDRFLHAASLRVSERPHYDDDAPFAARWELPAGESLALFYCNPEEDGPLWTPPPEPRGWLSAPFGVLAGHSPLHTMFMPLAQEALSSAGESTLGLDALGFNSWELGSWSSKKIHRFLGPDSFGPQDDLSNVLSLSLRALEAVCCSLMGWHAQPFPTEPDWQMPLAQALSARSERNAIAQSASSFSAAAARRVSRL